jgi:hypothetical protein
MERRTSTALAATFFLFFSCSTLFAQSYSDGPIELIVKVRDINVTFSETDLGFFGVVGQPDDLTFYVSARDNADLDGSDWQSSGCLTSDFSPPGTSTDFNTVLLDYTYPSSTVPQFFDLRLDAWEDESPDELLGVGCGGTRCSFETDFCCGGFLFGVCLGAITSDQFRCDADPFLTGLDYRQGAPCQWYDFGYLAGNCPANNFYQPRIETYWRYTRGENTSDPFPLGALASGDNTSQTNSNECYGNNYAASAGNDVFYSFSLNEESPFLASLCGGGNTTFDSELFLLDDQGNLIAENDNACGFASRIFIDNLAAGELLCSCFRENRSRPGLIYA